MALAKVALTPAAAAAAASGVAVVVVRPVGQIALFRLPELGRHSVVALAAHQSRPERRRLRRLRKLSARGAGGRPGKDGEFSEVGQSVGQLIGFLRNEEADPSVIVARLRFEIADEFHCAEEDVFGVHELVVVPGDGRDGGRSFGDGDVFVGEF